MSYIPVLLIILKLSIISAPLYLIDKQSTSVFHIILPMAIKIRTIRVSEHTVATPFPFFEHAVVPASVGCDVFTGAVLLSFVPLADICGKDTGIRTQQ